MRVPRKKTLMFAKSLQINTRIWVNSFEEEFCILTNRSLTFLKAMVAQKFGVKQEKLIHKAR